MIRVGEKNGRKALLLTNAEIVYIGEVQEGISARTGNPWKLRNVNIKFVVGHNVDLKEETMIVSAKCVGELCDRIGFHPIGTHCEALIRLDINTRWKVAQTECTLLDITTKP